MALICKASHLCDIARNPRKDRPRRPNPGKKRQLNPYLDLVLGQLLWLHYLIEWQSEAYLSLGRTPSGLAWGSDLWMVFYKERTSDALGVYRTGEHAGLVQTSSLVAS